MSALSLKNQNGMRLNQGKEKSTVRGGEGGEGWGGGEREHTKMTTNKLGYAIALYTESLLNRKKERVHRDRQTDINKYTRLGCSIVQNKHCAKQSLFNREKERERDKTRQDYFIVREREGERERERGREGEREGGRGEGEREGEGGRETERERESNKTNAHSIKKHCYPSNNAKF